MVNKNRLVDGFLEIVRIDSLTYRERQMADFLTKKLEAMGLSVVEDDAGSKIGGNAGNLICTINGSRQVPGILFMAHMDTVAPGLGKNPVVDGDIIRTDGKTVLGSDDGAGIACVMEALKVVLDNRIPHGNIQIVFSVAEESGLYGAKNMDFSRISARYGFVLDGGVPTSTATIRAPSKMSIKITVKGKAAHAGAEPEKGISAIQIAAEAIAGMPIGRIDEETTVNIGTFQGGMATNIVCDTVLINAETRSRSEKKLELLTANMRKRFEEAASRLGGHVIFEAEREYKAFSISEDDSIISILRMAAAEMGIELRLGATGGGSDTNILNEKGIQSVGLCVGMEKVHTVEEQIRIENMVKAVRFIIEIIRAVQQPASCRIL